jgi:hypothetical protein
LYYGYCKKVFHIMKVVSRQTPKAVQKRFVAPASPPANLSLSSSSAGQRPALQTANIVFSAFLDSLLRYLPQNE